MKIPDHRRRSRLRPPADRLRRGRGTGRRPRAAAEPRRHARLHEVHARARHRHARPRARPARHPPEGPGRASRPRRWGRPTARAASTSRRSRPPELTDGAAEGVPGGGARARALHARARDRHARSDLRRGRPGGDRVRHRPGGTGPDPDDPKWKAAEEACRDELPFGGGLPRPRTGVKRAAVAAAGVARGRRRAVVAGRRRRRGAARARGRRRHRYRDVERRDLVDRESVDGTLGYADAAPLRAGAAGTVTALPEPGSVIRRGESLYRLDDEPAAWLLYGSLPAWRDFSSGMTDGEDVRQLERNLRALGHDPDGDMTVDDDWDWATTAAVLRFQDERGLTEDGTLGARRGRLPTRAGARRRGAGGARAVGRAGRPDRRPVDDAARGHRRPRGHAPVARPRGRARDGRAARRQHGPRPHHRRRQGCRAAARRRGRADHRGHDRPARQGRARPRLRPGAGRRRLRGRAPPRRARRPGDRAAGPRRRRLRGRDGRRRRAGRRRARRATPRTTSRSAATACARA